jgi:hypothetical protein
VAGKYSLHDISNKNRNKLGQFAARYGVKINSTTFPHKGIHLATWRIPGSSEVNQTDHASVPLRQCTSTTDVRSSRGPKCGRDHYLVKTEVRERDERGWTQRSGTYRNYKKVWK